jgi:hypothetical protein
MRQLAEAIAAGSGGQARVAAVTPERAAELWGAFPALLLGPRQRHLASPRTGGARLAAIRDDAVADRRLARGSYAAAGAAA